MQTAGHSESKMNDSRNDSGSEWNCNKTCKDNILVIILGSGALISLFTCAIAIAIFFCDLRCRITTSLGRLFTYRLALYLVISAMFYSIASMFVFGEISYNPSLRNESYWRVQFCEAAGFFMLYSDWIMLLLTTIITIHLLLFTVFHISLENLLGFKLEIGIVLFSLIFPLFYVWIPFQDGSFGKAGAPWCWIKNSTGPGHIEQTIWYLSSSFLLFFNTVVILVIIGVLVFRSARSRYKRYYSNDLAQHQLISSGHKAGSKSSDLLKITLPLLAYPIVYELLCFFAFVHRWFGKGDSFSPIWIVHALVSAGQGFFVAVTLISHLCLVKAKRSVSTTLPRPHKVDCKNVQTADPTDKRTYKRISSKTVTSVNTTHYHIPHESEVDRTKIQCQMAEQCSSTDLVTDENTSSWQEYSILNTSDAEVTKYHHPRESTIDDLFLKRQNSKKCASTRELQQLDIVELSEDKYVTSVAEVDGFSDEDTTDWRVPRESVVDESALLRKIV